MLPKNNASKEILKCRLCDGKTESLFTLRNMHRYDVRYYLCSCCNSLQTENPFWLDEAYSDPVRYTDTFAAQRALSMPRLTLFVAWILGIPSSSNVLDWGGGDGLTTRILRDLGFAAHCHDKYAANTYAGGFNFDEATQYDIVTCFEVLEHMVNPRIELGELLARRPRMVFLSTCFYSGQDESWTYLAPYSGRHIFFYTVEALASFAESRGYDYILTNNLIVFSSTPISKLRKLAIRFILSQKGKWTTGIYLSLRPPRGRTERDWYEMRIKVGDTEPYSTRTPIHRHRAFLDK